MTEPTTAAGRAARDWFLVRARFVRGGLPDAEMIEHILAIEAEARAAALDEARAAVHRAIDEWLASPADTDLTALIDAAIDALREGADKP